MKNVTRKCLMHMKCNVISFLVLAISVSILVLLDLVTTYYDYLQKQSALFRGESSTQIWSKILQKKLIYTQMGDLEIGSTDIYIYIILSSGLLFPWGGAKCKIASMQNMQT